MGSGCVVFFCYVDYFKQTKNKPTLYGGNVKNKKIIMPQNNVNMLANQRFVETAGLYKTS